MSSEDATKEEKQAYLKENILNKGYNPQEYIEFLTGKRGPGAADVTKWNMSELIEVTNEFMQQQNQKSSMANLFGNNQAEEPKQQVQEQPKTTSGPIEQNRTDILGVPYDKIVKCQKIEQTDIGKNSNAHCTIVSFEEVKGGIFQKTFVLYTIKTEPLNWEVKRRYSDFELLRELLIKVLGASVIPPIPSKHFGKDQFETPFLERRKRYLEKFLNYCLMDDYIKNCKIFEEFLSTENDELWTKKKTSYGKVKVNLELKEVRNFEGEINCYCGNDRETYFDNIKDNAQLNEKSLTKLDEAFKAFNKELLSVIQRGQEIVSIFNELNLCSNKYLDPEGITEGYKQCTENFKFICDCLSKYSELINVDIREYFKFLRNDFVSMNAFVKAVDDKKSNFYSQQKSLENKKETLFKGKKTTNWDIRTDLGPVNQTKLIQDKEYAFARMLPKDTKATNTSKQIYGYFLNRMIDEFERIRERNSKNMRKNITSYCDKQNEILTVLHNKMADIIAAMHIQENGSN